MVELPWEGRNILFLKINNAAYEAVVYRGDTGAARFGYKFDELKADQERI